MDDEGLISGRDSEGIFFFFAITVSKSALGPTQPPMPWVLGPLSPRIRRPGPEIHYLSPFSVEVKNVWNYTSIPIDVFMA
jgi:hypothetical protein